MNTHKNIGKTHLAQIKANLSGIDFQTKTEKLIKGEILKTAENLNNASRANSAQYERILSGLLLDLAVAELEPETCPICGGEVEKCPK